ncbi:MAG: hypothetical protein PF630_11490 [Gammaproteobacteria bacterium]|nr:hypothetical protein [Gammaproteobacteria bacterium]
MNCFKANPENSLKNNIMSMNLCRWLAIGGYPLLIIVSLWLQQPQLRSLGLPLLAIVLVGPLSHSRKNIVIIMLLTCGLALLVLWKPVLALWPPSLLCLSVAVMFGLSLRPGKTPLIERFATIVLHANDQEAPHNSERWMRVWTWLWTAMMALLGLVAVALALVDMASAWSIWMVVVVPTSMLILLLIEFYLRRYRFPEQPRWSPVYFLRAVVRVPPHKITE